MPATGDWIDFARKASLRLERRSSSSGIETCFCAAEESRAMPVTGDWIDFARKASLRLERCSSSSGIETCFCAAEESRDDWIRTSDLLVPNQAHYQAVLHPVSSKVRAESIHYFSKNTTEDFRFFLRAFLVGKCPKIGSLCITL